MKRFFPALAVIALLIANAGLALAQQSVEVGEADEGILTADGKRLYLVEFTNAPASDGGDLASILAEQSTFRAAAGQSGVRYNENKAFQTLWNGLSIAVDPRDLNKVRRVPGVSALYPVMEITLPDSDPVDELELATALSMTGADVAQNTLGLTGAGIKVGIIDTGQDYDHPDLGGDGVARSNSSMFPNSRSLVGHDFVGDAWAPGGVRMPDAYPDDCNGHGTHVSGIVGANGAIKGVAPGVTFGVYKVFGCGRTTQTDVMLEAMEMAFADGMDVINMSIGAAMQWPSYPTASAAKRLVNHGMAVVASAGNDGGIGLYASAAPAVGSKVISVASFDNTAFNQSTFTVSPDDQPIGYNPGSGAPPPPTSGTYPIVRTGTTSSPADGCTPFAPGSLAGNVALIRRGTCSFYIKAINAQNAGAVAVILYNNTTGQLTPTVAGTPPVTIPVVMVTAADGELLDARIAAGPTTITWTPGFVSIPNATGGFISSFSSWGVSPDLSIKPDIGAPGGLIRSSVPIEQGSYAIFSGTSMSSPHTAGAVALLLEAEPSTPANAVRDILMNSADPHGLSPSNPGLLNAVHRQGAGMLDIPGAVLANTRIEPGQLSLGESEGGSVVGSLILRNISDHTISYMLGHSPAIATGHNACCTSSGLFGVPLFIAPSTVSFSANPVVVPAGGSALVDVTVTPNAGLADRSLFTGYVDVTPDDGSPDYSVPYTGLKGDYQSIMALTPTPFGFPWLAKRSGTTLINQPAGASYSMSGEDFPVFVFHLDHPVSLVRMEAFDAVSGQSWHRILDQRDLRRNAAPGSNTAGVDFFFSVTWDGETFHGSQVDVLPNDDYVVTISTLKANGDANNPAHWESWTSPVVTIARPDLLVEGLWVSQNVVNSGDQVTVSAGIKNGGASAVSGVHVEIFDNDELIGSSDLDLGAGTVQIVESPWTVGEAAQHRLRIKVTPQDGEVSQANNELVLDVNLGEAIVGVGAQGPRVLAFAPAKPNPFNGKVAFRFSLPEAGAARLDVFDLAGRRLKTWRWNTLEAGDHSVEWDGRTEAGRSAPAGTVLLRLNAMGRSLTQKAVRIN